MNTPNDTLLRERSLAFLIRAADQLVRAESADILASEGIRRHDLRLLRRLAHRRDTDAATGDHIPSPDSPSGDTASTDGSADERDAPFSDSATGGTGPDARTADADPTRVDPRHGHHSRGHHPRARFGGFRLRHLVMRGWVALTDGRPVITAEGDRTLTRIDERLTESRTRIESALTPEQLAGTTNALATIVEELGGTDRLREVRRRRRLVQHLRDGGPRRGLGRHGFGRHSVGDHDAHGSWSDHRFGRPGVRHGGFGRESFGERGARGAHGGHGAWDRPAAFPGGGGCDQGFDHADRQGYRGRHHRGEHGHSGFPGEHGHSGFRGGRGGFRGHGGFPGEHGHGGFPRTHENNDFRDGRGDFPGAHGHGTFAERHDGFPGAHGHSGFPRTHEHSGFPGVHGRGGFPGHRGFPGHGDYPGEYEDGRRHRGDAGHHRD